MSADLKKKVTEILWKALGFLMLGVKGVLLDLFYVLETILFLAIQTYIMKWLFQLETGPAIGVAFGITILFTLSECTKELRNAKNKDNQLK